MWAGLPNPFSAARYHSLVADPSTQPLGLRVTAWSDDREVMAIQHERLPVFGFQFHPESILTQSGYQLLRNFLVAAHVPNVSGELPTNDLLGNEQPATPIGQDSNPLAVFPGSGWS
jgi:GMP synthase-like glutamine amidotransferase